MENLLKELIRNETIKSKKYILFMLLKFSNLVKPSKDPSQDTPLFIIENGEFMLIYPDENLGGMEFVFTDHDEILTVLQKTFYDFKTVYLEYNEFFIEDAKDEILKKIDEALDKNDKELFLHYSLKLKHLK